MFTQVGGEYLIQRPCLQIAYTVWQPGLALTGVAGSSLVYEYRVPWPGADGLDAHVLLCVYAVVVEQPLVYLHLSGAVIMSNVSGRDSSGF